MTVVRMHAPLQCSRYWRTPSDWNLILPSWRRRTLFCSSFLHKTYCVGSARLNAAASRSANHMRVRSRPRSRYMAPTTASKQLAILSLARWQLSRRIFCNTPCSLEHTVFVLLYRGKNAIGRKTKHCSRCVHPQCLDNAKHGRYPRHSACTMNGCWLKTARTRTLDAMNLSRCVSVARRHK
jgi:hypothetical protein